MPTVYTYFILAAFSALMISFTNLKKLNRLTFLLLLFFIIAITGLRSEYVGTDSLQYYLTFKELNSMALSHAYGTRYAIGYVTWTRFIGSFIDSPYAFFFITASITLSVYFYFLKRYSINIYSSIIVFFCLNWTLYMVAMRQAYAMIFILLGIPFLLQRKLIFFIVFVIIAMQFHSAAITALFLIPLLKIELNKKNIAIFCGVTIFLFFSMNILWLLVRTFGGAYAQYMAGDYDVGGTSFINDIIIKIMPSLFIFCLGYWGCKNKASKENRFFLTVCLFNICIAVIGLNSVIFTRLNGYFDFANPIVFSYFLASNQIKKSSAKSLTMLALLLFVAFFTVIQIARPEWMKISPYSPFWSPVNEYGLYATQYFW